ncbi:MAG: hypothetical protein ACYTKD_25190 [Planctomycetota bacterium]
MKECLRARVTITTGRVSLRGRPAEGEWMRRTVLAVGAAAGIVVIIVAGARLKRPSKREAVDMAIEDSGKKACGEALTPEQRRVMSC